MLKCFYTTGDVLGPYFRFNAPLRNDLTKFGADSNILVIKGKITSEDCSNPINDAVIEIWLADDKGEYDINSNEFKNRGKWLADNEGNYLFKVRLPGKYKLGDNFRPAHIHFRITKKGIHELVTQIYFIGDPDILKDPFASLPYSKNRILPIYRDDNNNLEVIFNINTKKNMEKTFSGSWIYRSFHNFADKIFDSSLPDLQENLLWFEAIMTLSENADGVVSGLLDGGTPDYKYNLIGKSLKFRNIQGDDDLRILEMIAHGATPKTEGHVYKYHGILSNDWPEGVDQLSTFTGTMIRVKRPDDPTLEGTVGCFICVEKKSGMPGIA